MICAYVGVNGTIQTTFSTVCSRGQKRLALEGHIWHSVCNAGSWLMICISLSVYFMGIKCFTHVNIKHSSMKTVTAVFVSQDVHQLLLSFSTLPCYFLY